MTLVGRGYGGIQSNLLIMIHGISIKLIIINPNFIVWISRHHRDLESSRHDVRYGGVESENSGVLEDETWLFGLEDGPYDEKHDEEYEEGDKYT